MLTVFRWLVQTDGCQSIELLCCTWLIAIFGHCLRRLRKIVAAPPGPSGKRCAGSAKLRHARPRPALPRTHDAILLFVIPSRAPGALTLNMRIHATIDKQEPNNKENTAPCYIIRFYIKHTKHTAIPTHLKSSQR
jgi:hypothetical protein